MKPIYAHIFMLAGSATVALVASSVNMVINLQRKIDGTGGGRDCGSLG
jgi:hypothetical protein